jgi:Ca-activated chloride channel family protein
MPHVVRPLSGRGRWAALALAVVLLTAASLAHGPVGRIEGTVRDSAGAPIAHAQVFVVGLAFNTLTDSAGHYRLVDVPVGTYTIRAAFIGYRSTELTKVPVRANQTTPADLILEQTAVALQEITVTSYTDRLPVRPVQPRDEAATVTTGPPTATLPSAMPPAPGIQGGVSSGIARGARLGIGVEPGNTENYAVIEESRFLPAAANPRSTFSIDVDAASYTNVRRFLTAGQRPPQDAVRIEEFLNYFRYDYPEPRGAAPFSITTDLAVAPWASEHRLLRIGIKGRSLATRAVPPSNLVFLLDVSGSMQPPNKLPLVKQAFRLLVHELRPEDRVAIVVYAGAAGLVLPSTPGSDKATILAALDRLEAGGSTAGGAGLRLAYDIARRHYAPKANNRVILATDGDFNVGESSDAAMVRLIEERRDQGLFLTVLGFGTGNLKDSRMEQIADKGNGHYAYVDNLTEARRIFVREFAGTLVTIAKDVKIQVEFNPARVAAYRLVGYENRALRTEDFADDKKDAGELGAGHTVTALYELVPVGASTSGPRSNSATSRRPARRAGCSGSRFAFGARSRRRPATSGSPRRWPASAWCSGRRSTGAPRRSTRCWLWPGARRARTRTASAPSSSGSSSRRAGSGSCPRRQRRSSRVSARGVSWRQGTARPRTCTLGRDAGPWRALARRRGHHGDDSHRHPWGTRRQGRRLDGARQRRPAPRQTKCGMRPW